MNSLRDRIATRWSTSQGLAVRRPITEEELHALESRVGPLPKALVNFLSIADGFSDTGLGRDEEGFAFWPSERMELVDAYQGGIFSSPGTYKCLLFADYLDWSWAYAIGLDGRTHAGEILMIGTADRTPFRVANTLEEFLEKYLADDGALYGP